MTRVPTVPSSLSAADSDEGIHTHPLPLLVRVALVAFAVGFLAVILGLAGVYVQQRHGDQRRQADTAAVAAQTATTAARVADTAARVAAQAFADCVKRHDNAVTSVVAYDSLLAQLSPATDPAIRGFIKTARDASQRTVDLPPCQP